MPPHQSGPPKIARRLLTAALALLTLLAITVGAPTVFVVAAHLTVPHHLPHWADITDALTAPDDGHLFVAVLALGGLLASASLVVTWGGFTLCVCVELVAAIRQRPARRLRGLAAPQRLAAALVAAILLTAPTVAAAATSTQAAAPTHAAATPSAAAWLNPGAGHAATVHPTAAARSQVYTVAPDDQLADIAARFLGDPNRYPELAALSAVLNPDLIHPGEQIRLPTGATDRGPRPHAVGAFSASTGTTATPTTPTPRTPTPTPTAPISTRFAPAPVAPSSAQVSPAAASVEVDEGLPVAAPLAGAGLLAALLLGVLRRRRRRQQQHRPPGRRIPEPATPRAETELAIVAQPIATDRLDQGLRALSLAMATRSPETMPDPVGAWLEGDTIHLLLTGPCPHPPAPWVDGQTMWTLPPEAALTPAPEQLAPLPTLVSVGSQPGRHLLFDLERLGVLTLTGDPRASLDLLRYLTAELASNTWSDHVSITVAGFDADQTAALITLGGDQRISAAPTITAGIDRARRRARQVRASLEHLGVGDPLAARIADSGADGWMPQILVAAEPTPAEMTALEDLDTELAAAGRCAVAVVATVSRPVGRWPVEVGPDRRLDVPFLGITGAEETLTAAALPRDELTNLIETLDAAERGGDQTADAPPTPGDDPATLWPPVPPARDDEPWAVGVNAEGGLLDVAVPMPRQPVHRGQRRHTDPTLDADLLAWNEADPTRPRLAILGTVVVAAPGPYPSERPRFYAEIGVYLAARGARGATADQFVDAFWPHRRIDPSTRRVALTRARTWLGETPDGAKWLTELGADQKYRLLDGHLLDWTLFRRLRARGEAKGPAGAPDLRAALTLVRGAPLAGADVPYSSKARNPYTWLPASDIAPHHLTSAIIDTAHHLIDLCLEVADHTTARWAVAQAWLADVDRDSDIPWRDQMRIAAATGGQAELEQLMDALMTARDAEVPEDLDRSTYRLLCDLLPDRLRMGS